MISREQWMEWIASVDGVGIFLLLINAKHADQHEEIYIIGGSCYITIISKSGDTCYEREQWKASHFFINYGKNSYNYISTHLTTHLVYFIP